jgi:hypothetical protein
MLARFLLLAVLLAGILTPFVAFGQAGSTSLDKVPLAKATSDANAALLGGHYDDAIAAADRGLRFDPANPTLHYDKSAALRMRGAQSWNLGEKNKDDKLKAAARADWTAVPAVADEALAKLPESAAEMRFLFLHEKAEAAYLLAHTSGLARPEALAAMEAALTASQDAKRPAGQNGLQRRFELAALKLEKADLLVDGGSAAEATQARAIYREVLELDPRAFDAMLGMSTACIIAVDWMAKPEVVKQSQQACLDEAIAFRAKLPPTDPHSAKLQEFIDGLAPTKDPAPKKKK